MSTSLRDQLLKVGLINQKQANDAERHQQNHERQRDRQSAPRRHPPERGPGRRDVDAKKAAQHAGPRQAAQPARQGAPVARPQADRIQADRLQAERKKAERKARFVEVKQLIEKNRLTASGESAGEAYHFVDGAKIKRITVEAAARNSISSGEAVILRFDGRYVLLPGEIAQRVRELDERIQVIKPAGEKPAVAEATGAEPSASDDAYAAFPVPDDLIW